MTDVLSAEEARAIEDITGSSVAAAEIVWGRANVVRASLDGGGTVIAKRPRRPPDGGPPSNGQRRALHRERHALELLAVDPESPAPRLLGYDTATEVVVLEDLPPGRSLAEILLTADAGTAAAAVVAYGDALGRMHAATMGREAVFDAIRGSDERTAPVLVGVTKQRIDGFASLASTLGIDAPTALRDECVEVAAHVQGDGWSRAFVHGDPCPDNTRVEDATGRMRIFDFEVAGYGSALLDACYLVAPFPTCWCFGRVPRELAERGIASYRRALGRAVPEALDEAAWRQALVAALAAWTIANAGQVTRILEEDREWGTTTVRPRVFTWLGGFVHMSEDVDRFPALRATVAAMLDALRSAWPDTPPVGDYPALATSGPTVAVPEWWAPGL